MNIWGKILKLFEWKVDIRLPMPDKCVICVAPHTSNWDFLLGFAAYHAVGRKANFLMKKSWFFWPLGCLLRAVGGIPVSRSKKKKISLVDQLVADFSRRKYLNLAVTPEGTRSRQPNWHTGAVRIAYAAGVPIYLGLVDYALKCVCISAMYIPTGDVERDMTYIKNYYSIYVDGALYPEKFDCEYKKLPDRK